MNNVILDFLSQLAENNSREFFHAHKGEYERAAAEFEEIVGRLMCAVSAFEDGVMNFSPKELTFKLNRDTRFSADKSPYKPAMRAHISAGGKLPVPVGYFLYIEPNGKSFLGGGLFADMFKDATDSIRRAIADNGAQFESILAAQDFKDNFTLSGTALKKVPANFDAAHPQAEYLKYKSWFVEDNFPDDLLADKDAFVDYAADKFKKMKPFNDFLNRALKDFRMPTR